MRRDRQFLSDILEAADSISIFLANLSRETFTGDDLLRSANTLLMGGPGNVACA